MGYSLVTSLILGIITLSSYTHALNNGLGRAPPMGWNSWNKFGCDINESVIRKATDKIVSLGLDKLGYKYINLDDCWNSENRTSDGHQ
jgi:alpha-galactosidase